MIQTITSKKRNEKIRGLLERHIEGAKQALRSAEAGHGDIAVKVLDTVEGTFGSISGLMPDNDRYPPSVSFRIKELLKKQSDQQKAFRAAIQTNSTIEAKTVLKWILDTDGELAKSLKIE